MNIWSRREILEVTELTHDCDPRLLPGCLNYFFNSVTSRAWIAHVVVQ